LKKKENYHDAPTVALFQKDVGQNHKQREECKKATKSREAHEALKEQQKAAKEIIFNVNGTPVENVKTFKYLGCIATGRE
jgi:hypothetical protein